jgi:tetrapyrrole methylase family protein/MazG family protein/ATP diphosphatase
MTNPPKFNPPGPSRDIAQLLEIMRRLRGSDGCPWDQAQTFDTIAPYTVEEAYEVAASIEDRDYKALPDELGDLLFQVVFHARMAEEERLFAFPDVVRAISEKMIRRHPHVFGDADIRSSSEQTRAWEEVKAGERATKGAGWLDGVAVTLPALTRATKLSSRAARVGFVWPTIAEVMAKLREEVGELETEVDAGDVARIRDELGDVLFVCANIARTLEIDPEDALRGTNRKFVRRFNYIETALARSGRTPDDATLEEMDALWDEAKAAEKA